LDNYDDLYEEKNYDMMMPQSNSYGSMKLKKCSESRSIERKVDVENAIIKNWRRTRRF